MMLVVPMYCILKNYGNYIKHNNGNFIVIKADIICLSGSIGSFFVYLKIISRCRDPPFINLNKKFELIGGINNGQ